MNFLTKALLIQIAILASLQAEVKSFTNIQDAQNEFISALQTDNVNLLEALFTKEYHRIVSMRDIDKEDIGKFLTSYNLAHRFASFDGKEVYIEVGHKGWTFPIPLVKRASLWHYDIEIGKENMKTREIGRNELALIDALKNFSSLENLQNNELVYHFSKGSNGEIIARPSSYNIDAIMSFVLTSKGVIYEADLGQADYQFDERFRVVETIYMINSPKK